MNSTVKTSLSDVLTKLFIGLAALVLSFPARADWIWVWVHGTSCHEEYENRMTDPNHNRSGQGLDFAQSSGTSNWIHCTVPADSNADDKVRYLGIRFYTGSVDAWVSQVHVYDGETRVKTFSVNWKNGWYTKQLDLGTPRVFSKGLGISIEIKAGVAKMSHRFVFSGAGARFDY
jgi:hypothetical protein